MTIKEFADCFEYNIKHNIKHAILGLGAPGVGKSQLIKQIGKKYGYKVIDIRLAQMSEVEIGGLIYPNESRTKTIWLAPEVLPNEERDGKNTILLLDEITSCSKRVQVAAYQLILDRRIGQYELPEGTFVVALGNREDDDGVYIRLAGPLADRFEIHYIEPDFYSWKNDFALKYGINKLVIGYLTGKHSALHTQEVDGEDMVFATPRSWERVSDILNIDSDVSSTVIQNKIIGNIGEREGRQFIKYCISKIKNSDETISADEYLSGAAAPPKTPDKMRILVKNLTDKAVFVKGVMDINDLNKDKRMILEDIIRGMVSLPNADVAVMGIKKLIELNRQVVRTAFLELDDESINSFILQNAHLLGLSSDLSIDESKKNKWLEMWNKN